MTAIITVRDLQKHYGDIHAVRGISFEVLQGEVFGLLGPNGAGKTTTVEILEGLRKADGGEAIVDGIDVAKEPAKAKQRVGVQLQQSAFPENFTAKETVELFALCYGVTVDAVALLTEVDLADKGGPAAGGALPRSAAAALDRDRAREQTAGPLPRRAHHRARSPGAAQPLGARPRYPPVRYDGLPDDPLHG